MSIKGVYDLTKESTLFQDTLGTQPVVDRIGYVKDQSGTGRDLIALNNAGNPDDAVRPEFIDGRAVYSKTPAHLLATEPFAEISSLDNVAYAIRCNQREISDIQGNHLLGSGIDGDDGALIFERGDGNIDVINSDLDDIPELDPDSVTHNIILRREAAGGVWKVSVDGGNFRDTSSSNDVTSVTRFVLGGRNIGFDDRSWAGDIFRFAVAIEPTEDELTELQTFIEDGTVPNSGPTTKEEIFNATYADASAAPPKRTALVRPLDVQRSIDTDVSWLARNPKDWTVKTLIPIGELQFYRPGNIFWVRDNQPGLRQGRNVFFKGFAADDIRPTEFVSCIFTAPTTEAS